VEDLTFEEGHTQGPDEWNDIDFCPKATIILCLSDEPLYNVMIEKTTADL